MFVPKSEITHIHLLSKYNQKFDYAKVFGVVTKETAFHTCSCQFQRTKML